MRYFLLCNRHSCIQKLILFIFIFLAFNVALSKSNETGIFSSPVFAQSCTPTLLGSYVASGASRGIYVKDNTAYVVGINGSAHTAGLYIINVTNSEVPALLGSFRTDSNENGWAVYVSGDTAYYATALGLYIIDVSNPKTPLKLGFYDTPEKARDVYVSGGIAYVADGGNGLQIVDVSNPKAPTLLASFKTDTSRFACGVFVSGSKAYLAYKGNGDTNFKGGLTYNRCL